MRRWAQSETITRATLVRHSGLCEGDARFDCSNPIGVVPERGEIERLGAGMDTPTFITLGPAGTCHENALLRYLEFQGLVGSRIELVADFLEGLERVHSEANAFLLQCSAHPQVHVVTEHYRHEVFALDTFLYPAKEMGLLVRSETQEAKTLGIVPAAVGYVDLTRWEQVIEESANPIVASGLLEGRYDAGVTLVEFAEQNPEAFRVLERFGEVDTTWIVYGRRRRFQGQLIGQRIPWMFTGEAEPAPESQALGDGHFAGRAHG